MPTPHQQFDAEALYRDLLAQLRTGLAGVQDAAIVGIHSGGAWLAERLAADLGLQDRLGFIDVSFYRDDYARKGLHPDVKPTHIGFNVDRAGIVLAALADRAGRELPVAADFVAAHVGLAPGQSLALQRSADGLLSLTIEDDHA